MTDGQITNRDLYEAQRATEQQLGGLALQVATLVAEWRGVGQRLDSGSEKMRDYEGRLRLLEQARWKAAGADARMSPPWTNSRRLVIGRPPGSVSAMTRTVPLICQAASAGPEREPPRREARRGGHPPPPAGTGRFTMRWGQAPMEAASTFTPGPMVELSEIFFT